MEEEVDWKFPLDNLPETLTHLYFKGDFDQPLPKLLLTLHILIVISLSTQKLNHLPTFLLPLSNSVLIIKT